uniref:BPTI/Kunitz inhibitor domain-containing protein n=1 Tax=Chelonoidis abingdonii TaxID=106734 RepID=A0A8C0GBQ8_CHEAB
RGACCLCNSPAPAIQLPALPAPTPDSQDFCQLSPDIGPCKAWVPRLFYNSSSQHCELFIYGGCQGNLNNFAEEEECLQACAGHAPGGPRGAEIPQLAAEQESCALGSGLSALEQALPQPLSLFLSGAA